MKNTYLFVSISCIGLMAASARADLEPYVCSHAEVTGAVEFVAGTVRTPASANDILPFAYNNTAGWTEGGDPLAAAAAIEVSQMTGDPSDPSSWTPVAGKTKELVTFPGESTAVWLPSGQFLYRAKMTVGETETYAYFNLGATTDIKPPMTDMTIALSATELNYTTDPVRPTITVKTEGGTTLTEGTDYTLTYSDDVNVGTCVVKVTGIGAYAGETFVSYTIIYPLVSTADPVACRLDLRTDTPLLVALPEQRVPWAWNSTAAWIPGGDANAIDVTYIPLAGPDAEPDESLRQTLFTRTGEGAMKIREPDGWCLVEMGAFSRRVCFNRKGIVIMVR